MSKLQSRRNALRSLLAFPIAAKTAQEAAVADILEIGGRIGLPETPLGLLHAPSPVQTGPEDEIRWLLRDLSSVGGDGDTSKEWYRDSLNRTPMVSPSYAAMPSVSLAVKMRWTSRDALASDTRKRREDVLRRIAKLKKEHPMLGLSAEVMRMIGGKA